MSLVQEWKRFIADEEEKLEKLNKQVEVNNDDKEKQIKMIQSIRECFNRYNFFIFYSPKKSEQARSASRRHEVPECATLRGCEDAKHPMRN